MTPPASNASRTCQLHKMQKIPVGVTIYEAQIAANYEVL